MNSVLGDQVRPWRKSSHSDQPHDECVEMGGFTGGVGIRDTKQNGAGPVLLISRTAARDLLTQLKNVPTGGTH
jgi:hypothetical protein